MLSKEKTAKNMFNTKENIECHLYLYQQCTRSLFFSISLPIPTSYLFNWRRQWHPTSVPGQAGIQRFPSAPNFLNSIQLPVGNLFLQIIDRIFLETGRKKEEASTVNRRVTEEGLRLWPLEPDQPGVHTPALPLPSWVPLVL